MMENFCSFSKRMRERICLHWHNHKLLERDRSIRVRTSIDDIHHRNRQSIGIYTAHIFIKRHSKVRRCGSCHCQRNPKNSISPEFSFIFSSISLYHDLVDEVLLSDRKPNDFRSDDFPYIFYSFFHAFS